MKKRITPFDGKVFSASKGFTLVEVITVLVIISILAVFAAPDLIGWRPKMLLKGAADNLAENLQRAKMHAIKNNVNVVFTFTKGVGNPCKGGGYQFTDSSNPANFDVNEVMTDNLCLHDSDFVAGDGFTSRGLPINAASKTAKLRHADLNKPGDPTYEISQSVSGGISFKKDHIL